MRIAIPLANGNLCLHFGHCQQFAILDVDADAKSIIGQRLLTPPAHAPGVLPAWLGEQGVALVIAGGMGMRAQQLFAQAGIDLLVGAPSASPESLVGDFLTGNLVCGANVCDH